MTVAFQRMFGILERWNNNQVTPSHSKPHELSYRSNKNRQTNFSRRKPMAAKHTLMDVSCSNFTRLSKKVYVKSAITSGTIQYKSEILVFTLKCKRNLFSTFNETLHESKCKKEFSDFPYFS